MGTRREFDPARVLVISPSDDYENVRFTFSTGANLTYPLVYLSENSEYIAKNILNQRKRVVLDLYELGWEDFCPYLIMFLEYIGGSYEYPLNMKLGIIFLKFSEFFALQGPMAGLEQYVIQSLPISELHLLERKWWSHRVISLKILEKVTTNAISNGASCLDVMRTYLDWIDEKSFKNNIEVLHSKAFLLIQQLIKMQRFYFISFTDKKNSLKTVCKEYESAYQVFDMQELLNKDWV